MSLGNGRPRSCDCGECRKCKHRDYMREWYGRKSPEERREYVARRDPERVREADRKKIARRRKFGTEEQRQKDQARTIAGRAIRSGKLERGPCEVCGTTEQIHAHHDDYSQPLQVRWFCRFHHDQLHIQGASVAFP